jgi:hypothetical protein
MRLLPPVLLLSIFLWIGNSFLLQNQVVSSAIFSQYPYLASKGLEETNVIEQYHRPRYFMYNENCSPAKKQRQLLFVGWNGLLGYIIVRFRHHCNRRKNCR